MKSFFSFLILLLAFVNLVSNSEVTYPLTLVHISGIFHEKKANQEMTLLTQGEKANPSLFKQLVLKEERTNELYFTRLTCFDKEEIYNYSYVNCTIDLSQIPAGFYKILIYYFIQFFSNVHLFFHILDIPFRINLDHFQIYVYH